jgi:NADH-quinone oxidoreductase subunit G
VIRVLANLLGLPGFDFESAQEVLAAMHHDHGGVPEFVPAARLGNASTASIDLSPAGTDPVVAAIYQLDGTVRRATSLQLTADGRAAATQSAQEVLA